MVVLELRRRFFVQRRREKERLLGKREARGCAAFTNLDRLLRGQFLVGLKAGQVRRALQEQIRTQPAISFHNVVVDAVAREQEDAEATMAVTNRYDPLHMKEEPLTAVSHTHSIKGTHPGRGFHETRTVLTKTRFSSFPHK